MYLNLLSAQTLYIREYIDKISKMDKKGNNSLAVGIILLIIFILIFLYGIISPNYCNRILVIAGAFFLIWLIFGSPFLIDKDHSPNWVFLLLLSILLFLLWIILRIIPGICSLV